MNVVSAWDPDTMPVMTVSQQEAAHMLQVRMRDLKRWERKNGSKRNEQLSYGADILLQAAAHFRKRSLNEVAWAFLQHAKERDPERSAAAREEIEAFFRDRDRPVPSREAVLADAQRILPRRLYKLVRADYERDAGANSANSRRCA